MAVKYVCDRCSTEIPYQNKWGISLSSDDENSGPMYIDLCRVCLAQLKHFLHV